MWKRFRAVCVAIAFSAATASSVAGAHSSRDYAVQVDAKVQAAPPQITLNWLREDLTGPRNYTVHRRVHGAEAWGAGITVSGVLTSFVDRNVTAGTPYEYQVVKKSADHTAYGYLVAGVQLPPVEHRGTLLLVVDNTYAADLAGELERLRQDLVGDGWIVIRFEVNRDDPVTSVKGRIKAHYDADPANVKAVFLFGHVPVPYSGDIVPDGHYQEHEGAWPCDGYYADMDGVWTDHKVNVTVAADSRNHNVPGDGKFDQSTFPSPLELMIGRVDLANMPGRLSSGGAPTFPGERELLRNYLNKNHRFRMKAVIAPERAIIGDYFGVRDGEAFAASGWRNFAPFFGTANITALEDQGTWIPTLSSNAYLWAYGCGSGSYTSIGGIGRIGSFLDGTTTELVGSNVKAVFTMLYGSWLGDWDSEDNIQRAVLATPDYGLTAVWSGRPHWFLHHMAIGEPIGFSARLTQNNGFTSLYRSQRNSCTGWTHVALMGDPTLRMHVVAPPGNVTAHLNNGAVALNWTPSNDVIEGYYVYRSIHATGPFQRVNDVPVSDTGFMDADPAASLCTYMVRAVKSQVSASGSYHNLSQGAFAPMVSAPHDIAMHADQPSVASTEVPTSPANPAAVLLQH